MLTPERAVNAAWALWVISWWAAAVWRKPAERRAGAGAEAPHLIITLIGFALIFLTPATVFWGARLAAVEPGGRLRFWRVGWPAGWLLFSLALVGFGFSWWARIHLGDLWSGSVTRKADHHVISSGPYARVRHPIYTGLIVAAVATATLRGTILAMAGAVLMAIGFWLKARLEERFLRDELGAAEYDAYAARTPMLVPRI